MCVKDTEKIQMIVAVSLFLICLFIGEAEAALNIRFVFWSKPKAPHEFSVQKFAKIVHKKTRGAITIEVINGTKTKISIQDALVIVQRGHYDGAVIPMSQIVRVIPEIGTLSFPFLFADHEHVDKTMFGEIGENLLQEFSKAADVKGLAYLESGFFDLGIITKRPIKTLEDLKGRKLRVSGASKSPSFTALGAVPMVMRFHKVPAALMAGKIDTTELIIYSGTRGPIEGYEKILNYVSLTEHSYVTRMMVLNSKTFDSLRAEHKKAILGSAMEASVLNTEILRKGKRSVFKKFEDTGIKIVLPDRASLRKSLDKIYENPPKGIDRQILDQVKKKCRHPPFCGCDGKGKK